MQYDSLVCMATKLTPTGRATLALAAARNLTDGQLAELLDIDPATLSRKKNGKSGWSDRDGITAAAALGDGIDELIRDLERLRATRQYHAPTSAGTILTGQHS